MLQVCSPQRVIYRGSCFHCTLFVQLSPVSPIPSTDEQVYPGGFDAHRTFQIAPSYCGKRSCVIYFTGFSTYAFRCRALYHGAKVMILQGPLCFGESITQSSRVYAALRYTNPFCHLLFDIFAVCVCVCFPTLLP